MEEKSIYHSAKNWQVRLYPIGAGIGHGMIFFIVDYCVYIVGYTLFNVGGQKKDPIKLRDCWNLLKENRALQMYIVAAASDKLALTTAGNTVFSTLLFGILIGNMSMSVVFQALSMPITIATAILSTKMARKDGAKKAVIWWTWFFIITAALCIVAYLPLDLSTVFKAAVSTVIFLILRVLMSCGQNDASTATGVMMPDIADYEASRSGKFLPGTVAACYTFLDKIISSLGSSVATISLAVIGYTTVMPQPTDPATPSVLALTIVMTLILPILGWLCTIVAMKWYPLTKEKMIEVQKKNHEAREAAKAEETPAAEA